MMRENACDQNAEAQFDTDLDLSNRHRQHNFPPNTLLFPSDLASCHVPILPDVHQKNNVNEKKMQEVSDQFSITHNYFREFDP